MKINWKVRFKNPVFWFNLAASIFLDNAETVGDVKIASAYFTGTSGDTLRGMCDTIRDNAKAAAVAVLVGKSDDKITMAVTVTKDAQITSPKSRCLSLSLKDCSP